MTAPTKEERERLLRIRNVNNLGGGLSPTDIDVILAALDAAEAKIVGLETKLDRYQTCVEHVAYHEVETVAQALDVADKRAEDAEARATARVVTQGHSLTQSRRIVELAAECERLRAAFDLRACVECEVGETELRRCCPRCGASGGMLEAETAR